jgi:hypothetical protein
MQSTTTITNFMEAAACFKLLTDFFAGKKKIAEMKEVEAKNNDSSPDLTKHAGDAKKDITKCYEASQRMMASVVPGWETDSNTVKEILKPYTVSDANANMVVSKCRAVVDSDVATTDIAGTMSVLVFCFSFFFYMHDPYSSVDICVFSVLFRVMTIVSVFMFMTYVAAGDVDDAMTTSNLDHVDTNIDAATTPDLDVIYEKNVPCSNPDDADTMAAASRSRGGANTTVDAYTQDWDAAIASIETACDAGMPSDFHHVDTIDNVYHNMAAASTQYLDSITEIKSGSSSPGGADTTVDANTQDWDTAITSINTACDAVITSNLNHVNTIDNVYHNMAAASTHYLDSISEINAASNNPVDADTTIDAITQDWADSITAINTACDAEMTSNLNYVNTIDIVYHNMAAAPKQNLDAMEAINAAHGNAFKLF